MEIDIICAESHTSYFSNSECSWTNSSQSYKGSFRSTFLAEILSTTISRFKQVLKYVWPVLPSHTVCCGVSSPVWSYRYGLRRVIRSATVRLRMGTRNSQWARWIRRFLYAHTSEESCNVWSPVLGTLTSVRSTTIARQPISGDMVVKCEAPWCWNSIAYGKLCRGRGKGGSDVILEITSAKTLDYIFLQIIFTF